MKPIEFPQETMILNQADDVFLPLPIYKDNEINISLWKPTLRERISILFFGNIWLWVLGRNHPAVLIEGRKNIFNEPKRL